MLPVSPGMVNVSQQMRKGGKRKVKSDRVAE
jgi:hypothetical protein